MNDLLRVIHDQVNNTYFEDTTNIEADSLREYIDGIVSYYKRERCVILSNGKFSMFEIDNSEIKKYTRKLERVIRVIKGNLVYLQNLTKFYCRVQY